MRVSTQILIFTITICLHISIGEAEAETSSENQQNDQITMLGDSEELTTHQAEYEAPEIAISSTDKLLCNKAERWSSRLEKCVKFSRKFHGKKMNRFNSNCLTGERWSRRLKNCVSISNRKDFEDNQIEDSDLEEVTPLSCDIDERWSHRFQKCINISKPSSRQHRSRTWSRCPTGERWSHRHQTCFTIINPVKDVEVDSFENKEVSPLDNVDKNCNPEEQWSPRFQKCFKVSQVLNGFRGERFRRRCFTGAGGKGTRFLQKCRKLQGSIIPKENDDDSEMQP